MATSMRAVKLRINATKKTSQITKAMNMISASKLKNAERHIKDYRPFLDKIEEILANIIQDKQALNDCQSIFLKVREVKKICYIVISSDKGLAGAFNINVLKELKKNIDELPKNIDYTVAAIGTKAFNYVIKNNYNKFNDKPIFIRDDVEFHEMREFVKSIVVGYILGQFDEVKVIYNHYVNTLIQNIKVSKLLPIVEVNKTVTNSNYEYDGKMEDILNMILPILISIHCY